MKRLLVGMLALAAGTPLAAQTVVTPTSLNGWTLYDGKGSGDPATITGAQPFDGNGSLQLNITNGSQQPAAFFPLNVTLASLLSTDSFGFSFLSDASQVSAPTFRFFLSGLANTVSGATSGSFGWFGTAGPSWQTISLNDATGNFFLRVAGSGGGQVADGCANTPLGGSFDDRRQTINTWIGQCTGAGGTVDLTNAFIAGVEVDYGSLPTFVGSTTDYADDVNFSFHGGAVKGNFNFEVSSTPEPSTLILSASGLLGLAGYVRRKRSQNS